MEETIDIPNTPCGNAFRKAMKGRQYGYEATITAWAWFQKGWDSESEGDLKLPGTSPGDNRWECKCGIWNHNDDCAGCGRKRIEVEPEYSKAKVSF